MIETQNQTVQDREQNPQKIKQIYIMTIKGMVILHYGINQRSIGSNIQCLSFCL